MKMLPALLVCAMMALTRAAGNSHVVKRATACPVGWTGSGSRCFLYISIPMTWADAARNCQYHGGNLASVHSFTEHLTIQNMILSLTGTFPLTWLGGSDATQEGSWFWNDGTPFNFNYWGPSQPDNYASADCLLMNFGGEKKFDDQPCHYTKPSVCAKKL